MTNILFYGIIYIGVEEIEKEGYIMEELSLSVKKALDASHSWSLASCQQLDCGIRVLLDAAQTDSDVLEIAEAHNADVMACFDYVYRSAAKERCKTCCHVGLFPSMFPCNACLGIGDYYEAVK